MSSLAFALIYAGLAALGLAMNRHARDVLHRELRGAQRFALRIGGAGSLIVALFLTVARSGWAVGAVEWFGMVTAGSVIFVLLLTYVPKVAVALTLGLPALAAAAVLLS
jgi:Protein of unknown function (DUF3325)